MCTKQEIYRGFYHCSVYKAIEWHFVILQYKI